MNDEGYKIATELCAACLAAMAATDDPEEKLINVMVMTNALNQWTLNARLQQIQKKSKVTV